MALLRSVATVGGLTLASRVLGFFRDLMIAAALGAGMVSDAFFVALQLPNMFRRLFAEGAFNAAFVPIFSDRMTREGRAAAFDFAQRALAVLLAVLVVFVGICQVFAPAVLTVLAPGFVGDAVKFDLAVDFLRLTFPYLLFISLVSLLGGVLNGLDRFAAPAAAPIGFNLCLLAALLFAGGTETGAGYALSWGTGIAGIAQFLWLSWFCRRAGMTLRLPRPRLTPDVRLMLRRMLPAAIGAGAVQINLFINLLLSSLLPAGAISYLFYANRLMELPLGVIGVALGTALLPLLAREFAAGRSEQGIAAQNRAIELGLLLTLPAAVAMIAVPVPIITALFERGAFGADDTLGTASALLAYGLGVPAFVLIKVLVPGFHARGDTMTPLRVSLAAVAINLALNLALIRPLGHVGLAAATSMAAWAQALLFGWLLHRRGHWRADDRLRRILPRQLLAAVAMGGVAFALARLLAPWSTGGEFLRVVSLAILVCGGAAAYACLAIALGVTSLQEMKKHLGRRRPG